MAAIIASAGLSGCAESERVIEIRFDALLDGQVLACTEPSERSRRVEDLRFYVSDPYLIDPNGGRAVIRLDQTQAHQFEDIALIGVVWPGRNCDDQPSTQTLSGDAPSGDYNALGFTIGLPFELNHANPLTAPPPLNIGSMFWTWQLGYKFLRLDLGPGADDKDAWSFHLGSTGCRSPSSVRPPPEPCGRPNRLHVVLRNFDPKSDRVVIDLDALADIFQASDASSCVGDYHRQPHCRRAMAKLALDADDGRCEDDCGDQTLFRIEQRDLRTAEP